jgi:formylglycine-generating enzyme required for sulfatase activity
VIRNVLAGAREVRVRDFSGREAARQLSVEENRTVDVALEVLGLTRGGPGGNLIPLGENPQGANEYWRVQDGALLVRIPAGEFRMGSLDSDGEPDERPQHSVYVSEFLIDKTEVSWRQFRNFAEARRRQLPPSPLWGMPDDYPAAFILWAEAKEYCEWVGGRLPTEAEWEKAARGTDGRKYPWGDAWDATRCNSISGGLHRPESVGSYPGCVSPYGVLDMPGSIWEWCADPYAAAYYADSPARDPQGPSSGGLRVMRGGAWMSQPAWLRVAYRFEVSPTSRNADHGFRCAMDAPE